MTLKQAGYFIKDHWIVATIVAVLAISLLVWVFSGGGKGKIENQLESNIDQGKGRESVIGNLVTNQQEVVNRASNQKDKDLLDLNNTQLRDSSTFEGSSTERFCRRFPCDSTCIAWRKGRADIDCR